ncbi:MAG TPA: hypothetical protein VML96_11495 [Egibacteraceae bacterium]|nr:hypothetical protein [Egibacteraceae bacterium]
MPDLLIVLLLAAVWWVPVFKALTDLQRYQFSVPRIVFWRWALILTVPIVGSYLYFRRGRAEVQEAAAAVAAASKGKRPVKRPAKRSQRRRC